jgi:hypothetical protein
MNSKRTIIVLGAGASFCSGIPMQENLIEKLFMGLDTTSGEGFPSFSMTHGLIHSFPLGQYLRKYFNLPEDKNKKMSKLDYWPHIQKMGYNLEGLYGELEAKLDKELSFLLEDFEAIIRTAVSTPTGDRSINSVCNYHRRLIEHLEPGDCIINFNWDSVAADALLYCSYLWFPTTGFGLPNLYSVSKFQQKQFMIRSYIHLYHLHGAVFLYKLIDKPEGSRVPEYLYVGPKSFNVTGSMHQMLKGREKPGDMTDEETRRFHLGYLYFNNCWFKPIFVPPSEHKTEYNSSYVLSIREHIHHQLISAEQIMVIGYSAPESDFEHLNNFFIPHIINPKANIKIINLENKRQEYRDKLHAIFPNTRDIDFSDMDFKEWSMSLSSN